MGPRKCVACGGFLDIIDEEFPGATEDNEAYRCAACGIVGLDSNWKQLEAGNSELVRGRLHTLRGIATTIGESFYYRAGECGFSGNWDVLVDGTPYRPAAATLDGLFSLLSNRVLVLAVRYGGPKRIELPTVKEF